MLKKLLLKIRRLFGTPCGRHIDDPSPIEDCDAIASIQSWVARDRKR